MSFYLGLDLGQVSDPTVGVVLESHGEHPERSYDIRHIEPYPLMTSYPDIIKAVDILMNRPPLQGQCTLVLDLTGAGRPIGDMFAEKGIPYIGITITTGKSWHQESSSQYHVSKELLISTVQKFIQSDRLRSSWRVSHSRVLKKELQNFRVKVTRAANEVYGPDVRENAHDDMVLATACGLWLAEHHTPAADVSQGEMQRIWRQAEANGTLPRRQPYQTIWSRRRL